MRLGIHRGDLSYVPHMMFLVYSGMLQSTGSCPVDSRNSFVREKYFPPKNPPCAERGLGCTLFMMQCCFPVINFSFAFAFPPHSMNTMGFFTLVQKLYYPVCKYLPSFPFVGIRLTFSHSQHCIQKKHSVFCPVFQTSVRRLFYPEITLKLFEYIL